MATKTCIECGSTECEVKESAGVKEEREERTFLVPYVMHEAHIARYEKREKRLWIALIISIIVNLASLTGFLVYESMYETISYEQDGAGINNVNLGEQGDINGAESSLQEAETR